MDVEGVLKLVIYYDGTFISFLRLLGVACLLRVACRREAIVINNKHGALAYRNENE